MLIKVQQKPVALGKVEATLEAAGIVSPLSHLDLATPIVLVMKQNGWIFIFGECWTIIQAIKVYWKI